MQSKNGNPRHQARLCLRSKRSRRYRSSATRTCRAQRVAQHVQHDCLGDGRTHLHPHPPASALPVELAFGVVSNNSLDRRRPRGLRLIRSCPAGYGFWPLIHTFAASASLKQASAQLHLKSEVGMHLRGGAERGMASLGLLGPATLALIGVTACRVLHQACRCEG